LKLLVDNQPRALSKADLHKWLWPGTFVSDVSFPDRLTRDGRLLRVRSGHAEVEVQ
jgi:DNA-binding winged helix-turn-helix (wHTH) protein